MIDFSSFPVVDIRPGIWGNVEIKSVDGGYVLEVEGMQWMAFDVNTRIQVLELVSHYELARGCVIVSGLGFGVREQMLLANPNVTSITVLEKCEQLIDYHRIHSPWFNDPKIQIVHTCAENYTGDCDVLLLDHYEKQSTNAIIGNVSRVAKNIKHNTLWYWPLEEHIIERAIQKDTSLLDSYNWIRTVSGLSSFPDLDSQTVYKFCSAAHSKIIKRHQLR